MSPDNIRGKREAKIFNTDLVVIFEDMTSPLKILKVFLSKSFKIHFFKKKHIVSGDLVEIINIHP